MTPTLSTQVEMRLRVLTKRGTTRRERVETLAAEAKELASLGKSLKVPTLEFVHGVRFFTNKNTRLRGWHSSVEILWNAAVGS